MSVRPRGSSIVELAVLGTLTVTGGSEMKWANETDLRPARTVGTPKLGSEAHNPTKKEG